MKLHEYQAKEIIAQLGLEIPKQILAATPDAAKTAAVSFPEGCVVKAQVHSGGRGKAGGVIVCDTPTEVYAAAASLIGKRLFTKQSGEGGLYIPSVLLTEKLSIRREIYFAITVDTERLQYVVVASACGGVEIEEVARQTPEAIIRVFVPFHLDIKQYQIQYLADKLELDRPQVQQLSGFLRAGIAYLREQNCTLIEINPLAVVNDRLVAADAKITFDDNALYLHPEIKNMEDLTQIDPLEREARTIGLAYVKLRGNIACLVNGAGLAMATMDIIKSYGGQPANFMDVGGGVGVEKVTAAFSLIMEDKDVRAIFVNIFGGIAQCDIIAEGIVEATKQTGLSLPLVVRLRGTHEEEGRMILNRSGLDIISIEDFTEAAKRVIVCAGGNAV